MSGIQLDIDRNGLCDPELVINFINNNLENNGRLNINKILEISNLNRIIKKIKELDGKDETCIKDFYEWCKANYGTSSRNVIRNYIPIPNLGNLKVVFRTYITLNIVNVILCYNTSCNCEDTSDKDKNECQSYNTLATIYLEKTPKEYINKEKNEICYRQYFSNVVMNGLNN